MCISACHLMGLLKYDKSSLFHSIRLYVSYLYLQIKHDKTPNLLFHSLLHKSAGGYSHIREVIFIMRCSRHSLFLTCRTSLETTPTLLILVLELSFFLLR